MSYKGRFLLAASHSFSLMHRLAALSLSCRSSLRLLLD